MHLPTGLEPVAWDQAQLLFYSHPIPMWIYDERTLQFVDVNEAALAEYGYARDEFLGMGILDIRPPEDIPRLLELIAIPRPGWRRSGIWRHRAKDGEIFHAEVTSHKLTIGDRPCVIVAAMDVTQRVRAEASARQAETRLKEAQRLAQVGSWYSSLDTTTVSWSDEMFRIAGRNPLDGAPSFDAQRAMYGGDGWHRLKAAVDVTVATGHPYEVEVEICRPDGTSRWIVSRGAPTRDAQGRIVALYGTAHDITERRRAYQLLAENQEQLRAANEQLERSERRYRELVENLNEIVWSMDEDGIITYVSRNAEHHGYRLDELLGRHYTMLVHPDDRQRVIEETSNALAGGAARCEYRAIDGRGDIHYVRSSFRAVFENGVPAGVSGVLMDITEQRRTEEQLRASQRLEAVGRLAGGIAHDFNNLLVVIQGYAELGVERLHEEDPLRADLHEILAAADRAASLTRQLLAFSRKQLLNPAVVNLNDVVLRMAAMLKRVIGEDIEFQTGLTTALPSVFIDAAQLEHAIMNLVLNARDAMPSGGVLRIRTSTNGVTVDALPAPLQERRLVVLSVEDTGHGMNEATRARIFEPFFTTKPQGKGTGLGLPMVYGFVKQSGGAIEVSTEPGRGSRFSIVLAAHGDAAGCAPQARGLTVQRGHERILVVEDEEAVRHLVERILKNSGYELISAATPAAALEIMENPSTRVDLLLTDVVMPHMSGAELAERALKLRPGLPVLYMTGYRDVPPDERAHMDAHAVTLAKPFTAAQLTAAIRAVLGSPGNEARSRE